MQGVKWWQENNARARRWANHRNALVGSRVWVRDDVLPSSKGENELSILLAKREVEVG